MRFFVLLASAAVAAVGVGARSLAHRDAAASSRWSVVKGLQDAFGRTANLRSGVGRCGAGVARRPGVPSAFHAEASEGVATSFGKDETTGLWALGVSEGSRYGSRFFADDAKKRPAGHLIVTSLGERGSKIDASYLAGDYKGTEFKAETETAASGAGTVAASGKLPHEGAYRLAGSWNAANVGTWTQTWKAPCGGETDVYTTAADGTATLKARSERGLALDLRFAPDRSGRGAVRDARTGARGTIVWETQGDGKIEWSDGGVQAFENWTL